MRVGFAGVVGFDFPAILEMAGHKGVDLEMLALLLPFADSGLRLGLSELKSETKDT